MTPRALVRHTLLVLTILVTAGACSSSGSSHASAPSAATTVPPGRHLSVNDTASGDTTGTQPDGPGKSLSRDNDVPDPCGLVTQAEASAFLGGPAEHTASGDTSHSCAWTTKTAHATVMLQVSVFTDPFFYRGDRSKTAEKLAGIGDRAYFDAGGIGGAQFGAQKGDKILLVSLGGAVVGGGAEPWRIETTARRRAFIALGKLATTRL
jgi:hypothetical protein